MTFWNMVRSLVSTELMQLAIKIAPPEEKTSANLAVFDHVCRILTAPRPTMRDIPMPKEPPPPDWKSRL